jgi:WD40 repeat protein/CHAT domain-containing protein
MLVVSTFLVHAETQSKEALPALNKGVTKVDSQLAKFQGHERDITTVVFSPNGRYVLTASRDKTARLWDISGKLLAILKGQQGTVTSAEFSPDGNRILTAHDRYIGLWDTSGKFLAELRGEQTEGERANTVEFSPDGSRILTTWVNTIYLWDISGNSLAEFKAHKERINSAVFSPNSKQILTASEDKTARLWDRSGNPLVVIRGHEGSVTSAVFSPDGSQILTTSEDKTTRLWDTAGNPLTVFRGHEDENTSVAFSPSAVFSPNGKQVLTASLNGTARLWDISGKFLVKIRGHQSGITGLEFSPDGRYVLTVGNDRNVLLWDTLGNLVAEFPGHEGNVSNAIFSPDGNKVLTNSFDLIVRLWNISSAIYAYSPKQTFQEGAQLNQQGTVESRQQAIQKLEASVKLYRANGNSVKAAEVLLKIGSIYADFGQFQSAIDSYNQALSLSRQAGAKAEEAAILNSLGQIYTALADTKTALNYHNQALPLLYQLNDKGGTALTVNNIGDIQANTNDWKAALDSYTQALIISRPAGDLAAEATALSNIGSTYIASQDWGTALNAYNQSLIITRHLKDKIKEAGILNKLGKIQAAQGQTSIAQEHYNQALTLARQLGYKTEEANILYNQALLTRTQNRLPEALTQINAAITLIEQLRSNLKDNQLKTSYFATVQSYYQFKIDLLMQLHQQNPTKGYDSQALETSDQSRARVLRDLLTEARANITTNISPALKQREDDLIQTLNAREKQLIELSGKPNTDKAIDQLKADIQQLLQQQQTLKSEIRQTNPAYANLQYPKPITLPEIQQQLDPETLILQYQLGKDQSYLWVIGKTTLNSYLLPKQSTIETAVTDFLENLTYDSISPDLTQQLLGPAAKQLGSKRLVIIPDGILHKLPFAALDQSNLNPAETNSGSTAGTNSSSSLPYRPLLESHEISYLPSASTIAILRSSPHKPAPKNLAILADPVFGTNDDRLKLGSKPTPTSQPTSRSANLFDDIIQTRFRSAAPNGSRNSGLDRIPFTQTEANTILSLSPSPDKRTAFGFDATYDWVTHPDLSQYRYIHLATHGLFDSDRPELSSIALTALDPQGNPRRSFLRLGDLFNLNWPADLVVLSACKTGIGTSKPGEGLIGMTRGLMYAGTQRVILTLWDVKDDATAELMGRFYQTLWSQSAPGDAARSLSPAAALRTAQLDMWRSGRPPLLWAAFELQGEWKP